MAANPFLENLLLFARFLRRAGVAVHHGRMIDAVEALTLVGVASRTDVGAALRTLLVHRHEDIARFDDAFDRFFAAHRDPTPGLPLFSLGERPRVVVRAAGSAAPVRVEFEDATSGAAEAPTRGVGAYSPADVSHTKDFADFTERELERARELLATLPWQLGVRRTRRWERAPRGPVDLRRLIRRNLMRGGELVDLPRVRRRDAPRPVVLIGDVSGSMDRYSRMLLHFVFGLAQGARQVEGFLFATRLTRVTRHLDDPAALPRLVREVQDWGGGTRIGESLRTFNTRWRRRVMRNGPVVLIVSDGWDRGDPELLERELARVRRSCRRLIWLNPLLGSANYEPLTRGMLAALRHVDDFLPAHNLASLEQLAKHLATLASRRPRRPASADGRRAGPPVTTRTREGMPWS
jgi:uncharacterized protein with von Willebrand factor type A (vWA) domain